MLPDWVLKHKKPGTTVKKIGNNYYLYYATSSRIPGKKHPVSKQTYIGKITPGGVYSDRVSLDISQTQACTLGELIVGIPPDLKDIIVLQVKGKWLYTKADTDKINKLKEIGVYENGQFIHHDFSGT